MGVFSSVLGFFGISAALRTSPVPIAGIKEKLFKPGESKDFDDLLKIAISLGVTVSVDSAALEREGFDGKYEPERNNIVLPAIPDRSKPEFYEVMKVLSHELYHASKYRLLLQQSKTEESRLASLKAGAKAMTQAQFVEDYIQREWVAENNALQIVFEAAQKDPAAPIKFKKLKVQAELERYKIENKNHYETTFRIRYLFWTHPAPGETVPELPTPLPVKQKKAPPPTPPENKRQRPGGRTGWFDFDGQGRRIREQVAANWRLQQSITQQRRQSEAILETNRRIRENTQRTLDSQRRIAAGYARPGYSTGPQFPSTPSFGGSSYRGSSSSQGSSDWWKRQRMGSGVSTTPPLPGYSSTFQRRPGYGGGMFDNIFRPSSSSPVPAGVRYPWGSTGNRWYNERYKNRGFD